jgi:hypothetical protein
MDTIKIEMDMPRPPITDCGNDGCSECDVCKRLHLIECAGQCGVACSIEENSEIDIYIKNKYGV